MRFRLRAAMINLTGPFNIDNSMIGKTSTKLCLRKSQKLCYWLIVIMNVVIHIIIIKLDGSMGASFNQMSKILRR